MNSPLSSSSPSFAGIDWIKFLMAFTVIAIHSKQQQYTIGDYPTVVNRFCSIAVPFFSTVSGFLMARKLAGITDTAEKQTVLRNRSLQLFRLCGYWLLIYLPIAVYCLLVLKGMVWWKAAGSYVANLFLSGSSAYAWPLWFIYSMAIVCFIYSKWLFCGRE
jgi:surface polysaccharide O-acyltransferase-like enzyme